MRAIIFLLIISSCSFMFGNGAPPSAKGKGYNLSFKESGWELLKKDERSDYVFEHGNGHILLSNSFCGEFQDEPLNDLARKTFRSVGNFTVDKAEWTTLKNREAYRLEGKGKVDGVSVLLKLLNTRRNNCYFDFVQISPDSLEVDHKLFDRFLDQVEFK